MGLRDKVALVLVTAVITQITIADCMPSSSRKASFQRYLDSFKQAKTSSAKPFFNKESCKSIKPTYTKCKNSKLRQETRPDKSLYEVFNFPETEYSLDIFPRDPFYSGTTFKTNSFGLSNKQNTNSQSDAFNNLRKQMRMKRKLCRSTPVENYNTNSEIPTFAQFSSVPELNWSKDPATFPDVQYPTNAMETWIPHYWNPTLFNPYSGKNSEFPVCDPRLSENTTIFYKPYKQQVKSKMQHFMEQIEKLKEKMRNASISVPIVNTSELNTNSSTYGETPEDVINSDLNNNNILPVNVEPAANNQTQMIPSNIDEDKILVNTTSSSNCKILDTNTQMDTITTASTTNGMEATTSQIEHPPVTSVPITYKIFGQNDMCFLSDSQSIQNDTIDYINETNNPPITETKPIDETKSLADNSTLENDNVTKTETSLVNAPNDTGNEISTDNTTILQDNPGSNVDASELLDINPTKPTDLNTTNSMPNSMPVEELKEESIYKIPYSSIFVVPVGNSISKIQLPTIESNTGAPIILILPSRSNNEDFTMSSNNPFCDKIHDTRANIQPTPMEYILEIPSAIWNGDFELLPYNSMCDITIKTVVNDTSVTKNTNPSEISQPDNSGDIGSNNGQADIVPTNSSTNDTSVPSDMSSSENLQPVNSTTSGGDNGQNEIAPTDIIKNDTSILESTDPTESAQSSNPGDLGSNSGHSENVPNDIGTNETSVPNDTSPLKNSQPTNSTAPGGGNGQGETAPANTVKNNTSVPESTSPPETIQPGNSGDLGSNSGHSENVPNDIGTNETSVPNDISPLKNSQPTNSTAPGGGNGQGETAPANAVKNNTSVPENTSPPETIQPGNFEDSASNGPTENVPSDTAMNDTSVPKETSPPENLQPDDFTASAENNGPIETKPTDMMCGNDISVPGSANISGTSQPGNSGDSGTNDSQPEIKPTDTGTNATSIPKYSSPTESSQPDNSTALGEDDSETEPAIDSIKNNTSVPGGTNPRETAQPSTSEDSGTNNPLENSQPEDSTASGENNRQIETAPNDDVESATVPESTNHPATLQPNDFTNSGSNNGTDITPIYNRENDTSVQKDTSSTENSESANSTGLDENSSETETIPSDTGKNDSTVSKDITSPETSQSYNASESEENNEPTETVPSEVINNDTLVPKNTTLPVTSQPENSLTSQPNTELKEITPTDIPNNDTTLNKDKELTETTQNVDPDTILDGKSLPVDMEQPLTSPTDNNLGPKMDKGLSNDIVPNTADDELPLNAPTDNINDLGLGKELPNTAVTNIVGSDKTLPTDTDLPLTLLTSPKISELDKRLADTIKTYSCENDSPLHTDLPETSATEIIKTSGQTNISQRESVKLKATSSNANKVNSLNKDGKMSKIDMSPVKQEKSKLVYTYKSQSNIYERQKPSDVTEPIFKDDNPVRVDIELPLYSQSGRKLEDHNLINNNKQDIDVQMTTSSGNIRASENKPEGEDKASISLLNKMSRDVHEKSELRRDESIEDLPEDNIGTVHGTLAPSIRDESVSSNIELTSAELKDLIKYLYISV